MFTAQGDFWLSSQTRPPSMEFSIQSPAVFAVVRRSTRAAVKEFVLAPLQVLLAPLALGGTLALLQTHSCSPLLTAPDTERDSAYLSKRNTRQIYSRLPRRCWVWYVKSITSPENSSMRKKNKSKLFWDEHAYFSEHGTRMLEWLASLAVCTSNSGRILLGRNKCTLYYALWQEILCTNCLK